MNFESWNPEQEKTENTTKTYELPSGIDVEVSYKQFSPKGIPQEQNLDKGIIFLPGLAMNPDDVIMKGLGESYANASESNTYVVGTKLKQRAGTQNDLSEDLFYEEALGVSEFIKDNNLKEVTIVGYSVGGPKAIDTVYILQQDPTITVSGLILLSSPGLYEQEPGALKTNLVKDSLVTPKEVLTGKGHYPGAFKKGLQGAANVTSNLIKGAFNSDFRKKIKREFSEMDHINPRAAEITAPVVIVNGLKDQVIQADKIVPQEVPSSEREAYLKENLFKDSPYVRMVTPEKLGKHGLPVFRPDEIADASLYLLNRFNRDK